MPRVPDYCKVAKHCNKAGGVFCGSSCPLLNQCSDCAEWRPDGLELGYCAKHRQFTLQYEGCPNHRRRALRRVA